MTKHKEILRDAAERGIRYREEIGARRVGPSVEDVAAVSAFDEVLTDDGCDAAATLAMLDEIGSPASVGMISPRFFGLVIGGSLPVTVATNWLTTAWDQNAVMNEVTPGARRRCLGCVADARPARC